MDAAPSPASPTQSRNSGHSPAPVEPSAEPAPPAVQLPRFVAIIDDYDSLLATIRVCIGRLNATNTSIELMSGLPDGYLSKVVGPRRTRHFGPGLFYVLASLGLRLALVEDPQLVEKYRAHLDPRSRPRHTREHKRLNQSKRASGLG